MFSTSYQARRSLGDLWWRWSLQGALKTRLGVRSDRGREWGRLEVNGGLMSEKRLIPLVASPILHQCSFSVTVSGSFYGGEFFCGDVFRFGSRHRQISAPSECVPYPHHRTLVYGSSRLCASVFPWPRKHVCGGSGVLDCVVVFSWCVKETHDSFSCPSCPVDRCCVVHVWLKLRDLIQNSRAHFSLNVWRDT